MASINIAGDTSGTLTLSAPLVAGSNTVTLPAATGTVSLLTRGTAVSASGTSVDFTGIPSWAKRITVMFSGVSTSGTSISMVQLGSTTFATTGYFSNRSGINGSAAFNSSSTTGLLCGNAAAGDTAFGMITIANISGNSWVSTMTFSTTTAISSFGGGGITLGGTLDRVRITTANGTDTFDAGSINVMWEG
jgi:hypothetical protein